LARNKFIFCGEFWEHFFIFLKWMLILIAIFVELIFRDNVIYFYKDDVDKRDWKVKKIFIYDY
jgi:hypothetical protein